MNISYPAWFPYPRCWLRSFLSIVFGIITAISFGLVLRIVGWFTLMASAMTERLSVFIMGITAIAIVVFIFPVFIMAHFRQIVASIRLSMKGDAIAYRVWPPKLCQQEGATDWWAFLLVGLSVLGAMLDFLACDWEYWQNSNCYPTSQGVTAWFWITFILLAYIHHGLYAMRRSREEKRKQKNRQQHRQTLPRVKPRSRSQNVNPSPNSSRQPRKSPPPRRDPVADEVTKMREELTEKRQIDDELEWLKREMEDKNKG